VRKSLILAPSLALVLTLSGLAALALLPALVATAMRPITADIEVELERVSEATDRLAAFERNVRKIALDTPAERPVPFGGFLARADEVKPGRQIDLVRDTFGAARAEVLDVERITQSVDLSQPAVAKMDLLLVRARLLDPMTNQGDRVVSPERAASGEVVHLLFAVRPADAKPARSLTTATAHQSL